jgi:FkbM family methyltransferase
MILSLDKNQVEKYFLQGGDDAFLLQHDKQEEQVIVDLGSYTGLWSSKIDKKVFNSSIYVVEPVFSFIEKTNLSSCNNNSILKLNFGIDSKLQENQSCEKQIFINNDSTSLYQKSNKTEICKFFNISHLFKQTASSIDLLQVNIEGEEYDFFSELIELSFLKNIRTFQVQFHKGIDNCEQKRNKLRTQFKNMGFEEVFCFPFVWEKWRKI